MFDKSLLSALVSCSLIAGCGSSDDSPTPEVPNQAPTIAADVFQVTEKADASLSVAVNDSDGSIASINWEQVTGPELTLTGMDSDTVTFTVPSVSLDTPLSFNVTATDNDGESTTYLYELTIKRVETLYQISGTVVGAGFAESTITASVGNETATAQSDTFGNYHIELAVDDDVDVNKTVTLTAGDDLKLFNMLPSVASLSLLEQASAAPMKVKANSVAQFATETETVANSTNVSITALSTAMYGLLVAANEGTLPENAKDIAELERLINPDLVIEAAAVINIVLENDDIELADDVDLVASLSDPELYNALVSEIETIEPGAIEQEVENIVSNPDYSQGIDIDDIESVYYQTYAVAKGFVARGGTRYEFDSTTMAGSHINVYEHHKFNWSVKDNTIELDFTEYREENAHVYNEYIWYSDLFTEEEKQQFADIGIDQFEYSVAPKNAIFTKLVSGSSIDTFRANYIDVMTISPIEQGDFVYEGKVIEQNWSADLMLNKASQIDSKFTESEMLGQWGFNVYRGEGDSNTYTPMDFERLNFLAGGVGESLDTGDNFKWSVTNGQLNVDYSDYKHQYTMTGDDNGDYSVVAEVSDANAELLTVDFGYATELDMNVKFDEDSAYTGTEHYYQTTVNAWQADAWTDDNLNYCWSDYTEEECHEWGGVMSGFQVFNDKIGSRVYSPYNQLPPNLVDYFVQAMPVKFDEDGKMKFIIPLSPCDQSENQECRHREWTLLKETDGILGKRIYVQEVDRARDSVDGEFETWIYPRWNMYELIEMEYFNKTAQVAMVDVAEMAYKSIFETKAQTQSTNSVHKVLNPTTSRPWERAKQ
ncbi:hypothetical protein L2735_03175 [Shewanella olleyana]|uniref:PKD domain-containing protein n=1 Tax=Shewanella olleyana TaxID=135626 RepID=UPI002010945C|nr:hypothetical protein [Shewanella olleyana]MCL1065807.1 hypothetical protein [Shewanella olleyana]